jgi:hypothetical protein
MEGVAPGLAENYSDTNLIRYQYILIEKDFKAPS